MKEYSILIRNRSGMPYILGTYNDIFSAKHAMENLVKYEEERNKMYYVDNDYFENKFCYCGDNLKYMKIQVREVTEWTKYVEIENHVEDMQNDSKIIYLKDFCKNTWH